MAGGCRCGNTTNANHPVMQRLIMDSLRQWVEEYHVDGFRFDLASVMCRDSRGHPVDSPPIVRAIAKDPVLSRVGPPPAPSAMHAMEQSLVGDQIFPSPSSGSGAVKRLSLSRGGRGGGELGG